MDELNTLHLPIEHASDSAWIIAELRAQESERPDACFSDPFARKIAGSKGPALLKRFHERFDAAFIVTVRTRVLDDLILRLLGTGIRAVVNLAAGLDTRPYRMDLPEGVRWVEVDYPAVLDFKKSQLVQETPRCQLDLIPADLANRETRKALFKNLGQSLPPALVLTEGLLSYLPPRDVSGIAMDLSTQPGFHWWLLDIMDPILLGWLNSNLLHAEDQPTTEIRFQPWNGIEFFRALGWEPSEFYSFLREGQNLGRFVTQRWPEQSLIGLEQSGIALLKRAPSQKPSMFTS